MALCDVAPEGVARRGSRLRRLPALAAIAAVLLSGGAQAQKPGGSIAVGMESDVVGFDPIKVGVYSFSEIAVAATLFDTLTTPDAEGKASPALALSWTHSEDYKTWTYKLRPNVRFHDGTPLNAQAYKWNIDRQKDPANKCRCAAYISNVIGVDAPDELTLVFRLGSPQNTHPEIWSRPNQNTVPHSPAAVAAKGEAYNRSPVGTGPFVLKSWAAGERIVVERNPNYWRPGHPRLDRVAFRSLPDGPARFATLRSGEVDLIFSDMFDFDSLSKAKSDKRFVVHEHAGSGGYLLYAFNTKAPPLDDVRVRRALAMAVDRGKMSRVLTGGFARPAFNPYGDGSWVKCSDDGALPYDPAKARELLRGYGKPGAVSMLVTNTPRGRAIGQVLQQFWNEIGAAVELEQVDQATIVPRAFQRKFQVTPWRIVDLPDPDIQMYSSFRTGSAAALAGYSDPQLDMMLERARNSADMRVRNADYCEIGRMINNEALWLWLFQNTAYAIAKSRVKGLPKMYGNVINVSSVWVE